MISLGTDVDKQAEITFPQDSRDQGLYIIGRRRMGKSKLMEAMIAEDLERGAGIAVFDPHGPLVDAVLNRIPPHRERDVVLLDITDDDYPFGLNLFQPPPTRRPKDVSEAVDQVVQAFKKVWGVGENSSWGPLLEDLLRNVAHTLVANPSYLMTDVPDLLYHQRFREELLKNVDSHYVKQFWRYDYPSGLATSRDSRNARSSTINKVREFLTNPIMENIVGQESTVDFRAVMEEQRILLVKLISTNENLLSHCWAPCLLASSWSRPFHETPRQRRQCSISMPMSSNALPHLPLRPSSTKQGSSGSRRSSLTNVVVNWNGHTVTQLWVRQIT